MNIDRIEPHFIYWGKKTMGKEKAETGNFAKF